MNGAESPPSSLTSLSWVWRSYGSSLGASGITRKAPGLRNDPALNQAAAIQQDQVICHQNDSCLNTSSRQKGLLYYFTSGYLNIIGVNLSETHTWWCQLPICAVVVVVMLRHNFYSLTVSTRARHRRCVQIHNWKHGLGVHILAIVMKLVWSYIICVTPHYCSIQ